MEFKKYPSLTNHYREKEIGFWLEKYPELKDIEFQITEKLNGANFQVFITKGEIVYGKRNSFLNSDDDFYDFQNVMKKYEEDFQRFKTFLVDWGYESIRIYGELFGGKIQKGVDYGQEKYFKLFDVYLDGFLQTPKGVEILLEEVGVVLDIHVPIIGKIKGVFNVLEYNTKFNSVILNKEDNICEGIVAKPYDKTFETEQGSVFYIKNKNEEFKEKSRESKTSMPINNNLLRLQNEFISYINDNRLDSVISKEGEIQSEKQIGPYIKLLMEDAKEDFIKDHEELEHIDKNDLKLIYKKGNNVSAILVKKRL